MKYVSEKREKGVGKAKVEKIAVDAGAFSYNCAYLKFFRN